MLISLIHSLVLFWPPFPVQFTVSLQASWRMSSPLQRSPGLQIFTP
jgi:hypothetical protein